MCPIRGDLFLSQDEEMSLFFYVVYDILYKSKEIIEKHQIILLNFT